VCVQEEATRAAALGLDDIYSAAGERSTLARSNRNHSQQRKSILTCNQALTSEFLDEVTSDESVWLAAPPTVPAVGGHIPVVGGVVGSDAIDTCVRNVSCPSWLWEWLCDKGEGASLTGSGL
jgi:hypothetical protein